MNYEDGIIHAINGESILFVGAGFSIGSNNVQGRHPRTGKELSSLLSDFVSLPRETKLEDASEIYIDVNGIDALINLLKREYEISSIAEYHKIIGQIPWKRVYTTNYDNLIEISYRENNREIQPICLSNEIKNYDLQNSHLCIHLNGYIEALNRETLGSEFKLTDSSYLSGAINTNPWVSLFRKDILTCHSMFFIGYSMYDLELRKLLLENSAHKSKTFFVLGKNPDRVTLFKTSKFGVNVENVGTKEFSKNYIEIKKSYVPDSNKTKYWHCFQKEKLPDNNQELTDNDFINLLTLGDINPVFVYQSIFDEEASYFSERSQMNNVLEFFDDVESSALVIHSDLGNGKTVFLEGIKLRALENGYNVFSLVQRSNYLYKEVEQLLEETDKTLVLIENYYQWYDVLDFFSDRFPSNIKLILCGRSSINDLTYDYLCEILPTKNILEISLNKIFSDDIAWIVKTLDEYGLWQDKAAWNNQKKIRFISDDCNGEFQSLLIELFNAPDITKRVKSISQQVQADKTFSQVYITVLILSVISQRVSTDLLYNLWPDVYNRKDFQSNEGVLELISFSSDVVRMKSSVAAKYILNESIDPRETIDTLKVVFKSITNLIDVDREYYQLWLELVKFRNLALLLPEEVRRQLIVEYYEAIKRLPQCYSHPLFWLQFAIACTTLQDFERADRYFNTAYSLGKNRRGWNNYQIDNHYARYLLDQTIEVYDCENCMRNFRKARNIINRQIQAERRHYPYRVAQKYLEFYESFANMLSPKEKEEVFRAAGHVLKKSYQLPEFRQQHLHVRRCQENLEALDYLYNEEKKEN